MWLLPTLQETNGLGHVQIEYGVASVPNLQ